MPGGNAGRFRVRSRRLRPIPRRESVACLALIVATLFACRGRTPKKPLTGPVEWIPASVPTRGSTSLEAIDGTGPDDVWAVGAGFYHYDGKSWSDATPPELRGGYFKAICAVAKDDVWAVGVAGNYAHFDGTAWHGGRLDAARVDPSGLVKGYFDLIDVMAWPGEVWITSSKSGYYRYDGKVWSNVDLPAIKPLTFQQLWGSSPRDVWLPSGVHFDGATWSRTPLPTAARDLHGTGPDDIWASGWKGDHHDDNGSLLHFDGKAWTGVPLPLGTPLMWSVHAASRTEAYAVGEHGWALIWNGTAWRPSTTGVTGTLTHVYSPGKGVAFAVGPIGPLVLRTR